MTRNKILRFSLVGISNTCIDFTMTNLLVWLFLPQTLLGLLPISLIACLTAMTSSYYFNRFWTFDSQKSQQREIPLFFLFSFFSMAINTSAFLFSAKYLYEVLHLQGFMMINLSKLLGVITGASVSFFSYAFHVFQSDEMLRFKSRFTFEKESISSVTQISLLMILALLVRGIYLLLTTSLYGDALNYSHVAYNIAQGTFEEIDRFWVSLFCYWQALFDLVGFNQSTAAILSTLIPGVLLLIPVTSLSRLLYGGSVAWISGLFILFSPRLISYSTNGYAEMFYLFALTCGIAALTQLIVNAHSYLIAAIVWGASFGIYTAVRNEGALLFLMTLGIAWRVGCVPKKAIGIAGVSFLILIGSYILLNEATLHSPGIFQKSSNLFKTYSEQLDLEKASRETYGEHSAEKTSLQEAIVTLIQRYPRNIFYTLQRMPGILLSPVFLFALLLPALSVPHKPVWGAKLPLIAMLLFPLLFFPLIQLEPRLLFPMLIPLSIFSASGLYTFCQYISSRLIFWLIVMGHLTLSLVEVAWIGHHTEQENRIHVQLALWIEDNVEPRAVLSGDGYGYITQTGFLSHHPFFVRLWSNDPQKIVDQLRERGAHWLILYEPFLEKGNPGLLPVLDQGIPEMQKMYEIKDANGKRYQIYKLMK